MLRRTSYPLAVRALVVLGGVACTRKVPHVKQEEDPPAVTVVADPPPSGLPAFQPSAAPHVAAPGAPAPGVPAAGGRRAGDHVRVRWQGTCYAAHILRVQGPGSYLITYEGYSHSWDETVGENRICK
jgi:hypothetical protein